MTTDSYAPTADEREALAEWLGDRPEARNVSDITDEATTVIQIGVELLADELLSAGFGFRRPVPSEPSSAAPCARGDHETCQAVAAGGIGSCGCRCHGSKHDDCVCGHLYHSECYPRTAEWGGCYDDYPDAEGLAALREQGEQTDAHLLAAANAYMHYEPPYDDLSAFSEQFLDDLRAALRAAAAAAESSRD